MKISLTDELLWEIYGLFEKTGQLRDFLVAPRHRKLGVWLGLDNPLFRKYKNQKNRRAFANLVYYLKRKKYITAKNVNGVKAYMITKEGISKALQTSFILENNKLRKDKKWIMLMFDIPQSHRSDRNLLKSIIKNLKYKLLQQSVWITPHDVSEKTEQLLQLHDLDKYVKIFIVDKI